MKKIYNGDVIAVAVLDTPEEIELVTLGLRALIAQGTRWTNGLPASRRERLEQAITLRDELTARAPV